MKEPRGASVLGRFGDMYRGERPGPGRGRGRIDRACLLPDIKYKVNG